MNPKVTFIVPCYKLAHLLPECISSILSQTYEDFEVLIMDDASPDNTPEVAASFNDPRVRHIRNNPNLGHLKNYNKGIQLALGDYIWLISADDRLRSTRALERYVDLLDAHPRVGYAFCAGIALQGGAETGLCKYSVMAECDTIFQGHKLLLSLLDRNVVLASSGIVRRTCYQQFGDFPLDLPFAGDWYLWSLFALHYDVGYIAEAMINYRDHGLSMTTLLKNKDVGILVRDSLNVLWRIKREAVKYNYQAVARLCDRAIGYEYARFVTGTNYIPYEMSVDECVRSIAHFSQSTEEADSIRARAYLSIGDINAGRREYSTALSYYEMSLNEALLAGAWAKYLLLRMGALGVWIRQRRISAAVKNHNRLLAKFEVSEPSAAPESLHISIIVCTRNRCTSLRRTLTAIGQLSSPERGPWELVIVDNNSTDETRAVVEEFAAHSSVSLQYVFEPRKGLCHARNAGLRHARGEIIAFTDDDVLPDPNWLVHISEECAKHPSVNMFFGQTRLFRPDGERISVREGDCAVDFRFPCNPAEPGCGNNMIFRKKIIPLVGEFDTSLGAGSKLAAADDTDFTYRVLRYGEIVRYCPTILVYHDHDRLSPKAVRSILFAYGKARGGYYCKHILRRDLWAAKMCYWEIGHFARSLAKKGKSVDALLHLGGVMAGVAIRMAIEVKLLKTIRPVKGAPKFAQER